jgi:hypothetical protein
MAAIDRVRIVRETCGAYESGAREMVEKHLAEDFSFCSPADVGIDLSTTQPSGARLCPLGSVGRAA